MRALLPWIAPWLLVVMAAACSKDKDKVSKGAATESGAAAEPAVGEEAGFAGPLSAEHIAAAKGIVKPFEPWDQAEAKLSRALGKATSVHGADHRWAATEGERCSYFIVEKVEKEGRAQVGAVEGPMSLDEKGPPGNWALCQDALGVPLPAEDPSAPDPPAGDTPVSISDLLAGVEGKRETWIGARVVVKGLFVSASTQHAGDQRTVTLSIAAEKDKLRPSLGCTLEAGSEAPKLEPWQEIRVRGRVHANFGGGLEECELLP